MNVLVTVGTGKFDELVLRCADIFINKSGVLVRYQVGKSERRFGVGEKAYFSDFDSILEESDLVITHAGAGTVFKLLRRQKNFVVVPNTSRKDVHQLDISNWLKLHNFCEVCYDLDTLEMSIGKALDASVKYNKYVEQEFQIHEFIRRELSS